MAMTGACLCGAIRFEYDGEATLTYYCHCRDCQRATGGPFAVCLMVPADAFRLLAGEPERYVREGESGAPVTREFCGRCGSQLFSENPRREGLRFLRAGTLDRPEELEPSLHIWTSSALPWALYDDGLPRLEKGPGQS